MKTLMWTSGLVRDKQAVIESLTLGPDVATLGEGRQLALLIDPALLRDTTNLATILGTLLNGVLSSKTTKATLDMAELAAES